MGRTDASGDVLLIHPESDDVKVEGDWMNGDITRLRAVHATHRVKARLAFRDLKKDVDHMRHSLRIRTDDKTFIVYIFANNGSWESESILVINGEVDCRGLRHHINYAENTVRVSVPRSCLSRPKWVRVGARTDSFIDEAEEYRLDDALSTGTASEVADAPTLGRKLRRC